MRFLLVGVVLIGCGKPPGGGADCPLVAKALSSFELGNYAEPEDRAPREAELEAQCLSAYLNKLDEMCILDATKETLAYCDNPLIVPHRSR
jgi:hypothetical protein